MMYDINEEDVPKAKECATMRVAPLGAVDFIPDEELQVVASGPLTKQPATALIRWVLGWSASDQQWVVARENSGGHPDRLRYCYWEGYDIYGHAYEAWLTALSQMAKTMYSCDDWFRKPDEFELGMMTWHVEKTHLTK